MIVAVMFGRLETLLTILVGAPVLGFLAESCSSHDVAGVP